jgi:hypothetical protein
LVPFIAFIFFIAFVLVYRKTPRDEQPIARAAPGDSSPRRGSIREGHPWGDGWPSRTADENCCDGYDTRGAAQGNSLLHEVERLAGFDVHTGRDLPARTEVPRADAAPSIPPLDRSEVREIVSACAYLGPRP